MFDALIARLPSSGSVQRCCVQLPLFENYIRPQDEFYITVVRLFGVKTATIVVILLSLRAKLHRVRYHRLQWRSQSAIFL